MEKSVIYQHQNLIKKTLGNVESIVFFCNNYFHFSYCNEHALRATLHHNKQNSKTQPPRTAEVLLNSLSHYIRKQKNGASTSFSEDDHIVSDETIDQKTTKYNDPFSN